MFFKENLANTYSYNGKNEKALAIIEEMIASEDGKAHGYFDKGVYFSRLSQPDSAVYFYKKAKEVNSNFSAISDNNIGHVFFVVNQLDSARKYFNAALLSDSTYPHAHFNLGVVAEKEGDLNEAMHQFIQTATYATASLEGFITNMQLYFGKTYTANDKNAYNDFKKKVYIVNMQYSSYVSIFYAYIRVPGLIDSTAIINNLFDLLLNYKQEDVWTWYHHACWKSLLGNKAATMESLEKAMKLGFGDYFMLMNDNDLSFIRRTPEFSAILKKYFPDKGKKYKASPNQQKSN